MQASCLRRLAVPLAGCLLTLAFSCAAWAADGQTPLWRSISDGLHRNIEIKRQELERIRKALPADTAALDAALGARLKLHNREAIIAAANEVGKQAYEFAATADGAQLSAIDPLLPTPAQYK